VGSGLVLAGLASVGCRGPAPEESASAEAAKPVVRTVDRGPVKLTVTASTSEVSIAERLALAIEVQADAGIEVFMPQFGESLAQFQIRDFRETEPQVDEHGRQMLRQEYDLDMLVSGTYAIPGITARYRRTVGDAAVTSNGQGAALAELTTDPIEITVKSLLEGEFDPQKFHDVKPVAELPVDVAWGRIALFSAGAAAGLGILGFAAWRLVRRGRRGQRLVRMAPHEWALAQLRGLADAKLIEQGRVQEFYYRLSEIARRYIELRFGLMAPERTTEEFLLEMRASNVLTGQQQGLLGNFLEACDQVKYALHEPGAGEIEQVFNTARDFVLQTRQQALQPEEVAA